MNILVIAHDAGHKKELEEAFGSGQKYVSDAKEAAEELQKNSYDFVIAPPSLVSFHTALPVQAEDIKTLRVDKLSELFSSRGAIEEQLDAVRNEVMLTVPDAAKAEELLREIYIETADRVFTENEWLELYIAHDSLNGTSAYLRERLLVLYREYAELFPSTSNDKTEEVILYILNNPESDLRQKTIAAKMYVNSSYLSTVFAAQTGERFVDYLTSVRLKRAAYLLMNSNLNVSEIAARLDYKDIGYFSRLFKARYGIPPSQYRIPDNYTYEI